MTPISIMRMHKPSFGLVQSSAIVNANIEGGQASYTFTRKAVAGNLLVISGGIYSNNADPGGYNAHDNHGNIYTKRLESTFNGMHIFVWECFVTSPPDFVIISDDAGTDQGSIALHVSEFQGVLGFNNALSNQSTVAPAASAYTYSGPSTPRMANTLTLSLFAVWAQLANTQIAVSATAPVGETQTQLFGQQNSVNQCAFLGVWKVSRAGGSPSNVTWTAMPNASASSLNASGFVRWTVKP